MRCALLLNNTDTVSSQAPLFVPERKLLRTAVASSFVSASKVHLFGSLPPAAPPVVNSTPSPAGAAAVTLLTPGPPARSPSGAAAPPLDVGALRGPRQSARVAALHAGEVPAPWRPPDAPGACKEPYAAAAQHHADPFGVLELPNLWPASSRSAVRPRPLPFGPAYNSSNFDIFLKSSYVVLVRRSKPSKPLNPPKTPICATQILSRLLQATPT